MPPSNAYAHWGLEKEFEQRRMRPSHRAYNCNGKVRRCPLAKRCTPRCFSPISRRSCRARRSHGLANSFELM